MRAAFEIGNAIAGDLYTIDHRMKNDSFCMEHISEEARFMKPFDAANQEWALGMGLFDNPLPYLFQLCVEALRKFRLAAKGHGPHQPPEHLRGQIKAAFDPLPCWLKPFEQAAVDGAEFLLYAVTHRPAAMYHSWGTQNAWLRQTLGVNPIDVHGSDMMPHGLEDGDWAWVASHQGRIKVPGARKDALDPHIVWTWSAIGKREGACALDPKALEAQKGFLPNHLIHELLPPKGDGLRWVTSEPVIGQAAWYDLRVQIEKAAPGSKVSESRLGLQKKSPVGQASAIMPYGESNYGLWGGVVMSGLPMEEEASGDREAGSCQEYRCSVPGGAS